MRISVGVWALAISALCACGGGGGSSATVPNVQHAPVQGELSTASIGGVAAFIDSTMHVVYIFGGDVNAPNASNCMGAQCASIWPPVTVAAGVLLPADWTAFARPDGRVQLAYKGMALYDYAGDTSPLVSAGDNIDEFGGVWRVARPQ
jgi:predicted lipoprotein with Yx(FWY)xxD motif